jgi:site-specific DNA-methyltransferase (adenine-specific)
MLNVEQLKWLADNAGFETLLQGDGKAIDVCVVALDTNSEDRFAPFNSYSKKINAITEGNVQLLREAAMNLADDGLLFIYGLPAHLSRYAVALAEDLTFRYWIAVRAATNEKNDGLRPEHTGLLLMSKAGANLNKIRMSHSMCRVCGKSLKDWGGKSHLMNPQGVMLSDVWMDLVVDANEQMPAEIFERILQLSLSIKRKRLQILALDERPLQFALFQNPPSLQAFHTPFNPLSLRKNETQKERLIPNHLLNTIHRGKCLDVLKKIPSQTVDLAFADPPFNLTINYNGYTDAREKNDYTGWCKRWLIEYERVLKPGGALFVLNLPKWSVHIADFLCRTKGLFLQNWIVWNALPEPKGLLMPAHYSLLYFTKSRTPARFNYCNMENGWQPFDEAVFPPDRPDVCKRVTCVRKRRASASTWRGELTDIWYDIARDRRNKRRAKLIEGHPCPTPEALIDRIIRLTTNAGDVVLDAFAGIGTTALVAQRLDRKFICIEQNLQYAISAEKRIQEHQQPLPTAAPRVKRTRITKRKLQMELSRLALTLGRLPSKADVEELSQYKIEAFEKAFDNWSEALKAAKISLKQGALMYDSEVAQGQQEWFDLEELFNQI